MTTTTQATVRKAIERGKTRISWLESYHTFSFGDYYDPRHMGFGDLRVINDDIVAPSGGFGTHGHRDMEIVTVVLSGELEHKDSMGNGSIIRPGDVQRMSAGSGVRHSEFNPSDSQPVHLLQIWILPEKEGIEPGYEQRSFPEPERRGRFRLIASRDGREGSVTIHQDAELSAALLETDEALEASLSSDRRYWLHVATGTVEVDGQVLEAGDAIGINAPEGPLKIRALEQAQLLLFNLRK